MPTFSVELQGEQTIQAQHSNQQSLCAMYYQRKNLCICCPNPIQHHYAYYGKMPWPCAVRGRHHYRYTACHKEQQCRLQREVCGKVEAEEAEIELHEIAEPDAHCLKNKQPTTLHSCQREQALGEA